MQVPPGWTQGRGVVLSGTATDGTLGLRAIKAEGGITFAQDGTALHEGMPQSASLRLRGFRALPGMEGLKPYLHSLRTTPGEVEAPLPGHPDQRHQLLPQPVRLRGTQGQGLPQAGRRAFPREPAPHLDTGLFHRGEVYSLAMAFTEFAEASGTHVPLQFFATDLNITGIDKAWAGHRREGARPHRLRRARGDDARGRPDPAGADLHESRHQRGQVQRGKGTDCDLRTAGGCRWGLRVRRRDYPRREGSDRSGASPATDVALLEISLPDMDGFQVRNASASGSAREKSSLTYRHVSHPDGAASEVLAAPGAAPLDTTISPRDSCRHPEL